MEVTVHLPQVEGDTVWYRWTQSAPNPFQSSNEFFLRYENIDLSNYSTELLLEIFLCYQTRVFGGYDEPVEITMPVPVSPRSAEFWVAFNEVENVTVTPLAATPGYNAWRSHPVLVDKPRKAAVFFGGGKD